jgi:hypothetical protein
MERLDSHPAVKQTSRIENTNVDTVAEARRRFKEQTAGAGQVPETKAEQTEGYTETNMPSRPRRVIEMERLRPKYADAISRLQEDIHHIHEADELSDDLRQSILEKLNLSVSKKGIESDKDQYFFNADTLSSGFTTRQVEAEFKRNKHYLRILDELRNCAVERYPEMRHVPHSEYDSNLAAQQKDIFLYGLARTLKRGEVSYLSAIAISEYMRLWLRDPLLARVGVKQATNSDNVEDFINSPYARYEFQEMFGHSFLPLSPDSQKELVLFCARLDRQEMEQIPGFVSRYGEDGLRALHALRDDDTGSLAPLWYGGMFGHDDTDYVTKGIFRNYAKIADVAKKISTKIKKIAPGLPDDACKMLERNVRARAAAYLRETLDSSLDDTPKKSYKAILAEFARLNTEALEFAEMFKTLFQTGIITGPQDFPLLNDLSFDSPSGTDISNDDREQMKKILVSNYEELGSQFQETVLNSLEKSFFNKNANFYILRHNDHPIGFCRFDSVFDDDGKLEGLYFGSFNVDQSYGNGKLGEAIFESAIAEEKKKGVPIHADCNPHSPISKKYLEWGFVGTRAYDLAGVPSVHIELDVKQNESLVTKKMSTEQLVSHYLNAREPNIHMRALSAKDDMQELTHGFVLSRIVPHEGKNYAVFEKQ